MFFIVKMKEKMILPANRIKGGALDVPEFFVGKFIKGQGLCVAVNHYKVLESSVVRGEGDLDMSVSSFLTQLELELLIFSPTKDEFLKGEIADSNESGLFIDLYFSKAFIPSSALFQPAI